MIWFTSRKDENLWWFLYHPASQSIQPGTSACFGGWKSKVKADDAKILKLSFFGRNSATDGLIYFERRPKYAISGASMPAVIALLFLCFINCCDILYVNKVAFNFMYDFKNFWVKSKILIKTFAIFVRISRLSRRMYFMSHTCSWLLSHGRNKDHMSVCG